LWYQIEGEGTISNPEGPSTEVSGLGTGANTFVWSIDPENGCEILTDTVTIIVEEGVLADAGADQSILLGQSAQLQGFVAPPDDTIAWEPGSSLSCTDCLNPLATPLETTEYFLTYTSPLGCDRTDSVTVRVLFELPNTITPDGDGVNDTWTIPQIENFPDALVQIFNRWGVKVFSSTGYNEPWDGRRDGEDLPAGAYYYIIDYNFEGKDNLNGTVNIIR
jgi:gliding motility-associated-like protein